MYQRSDNGLWCEKITVNGKQKVLSSKTKAGLKKKLLDYDVQKSHEMAFNFVCSEWVENKSAQLAYNTVQAYKPHIQRSVDYFGDTSVTDITPAEVQAFIDGLASKGFARDTVRRALVICNEVFDYAILMPNSTLRFNPCSAVKVPKGLKKTRREPPTSEQLAKITPDTEMGLFAWFLLYTGLRRGELLALQWEDIDRDNKLITVNKAVYFENGHPMLKDTKTECSTRKVALLDVLADVLPNRKHGYIFGGEEPWSSNEFNRKWVDWCRQIGLAEEITYTHTNENNKHTYTCTKYKPLVTCHQFRHWYATLLESAGISEFGAKTALGHSSITVTKDIYTHIRNSKDAEITDKLNTYLEKGMV